MSDINVILEQAEFDRCMIMLNGGVVDGYLADYNGTKGKGQTPTQAAGHVAKKLETQA